MTIAEQLKKSRAEKGLSQEAVANEVGLARRSLAYYESGERIPNAEILMKLCEFYSLDINSLISSGIEKKTDDNNKDPIDTYKMISKIDEYLSFEKAKKQAVSKTVFYVALVTSILIVAFTLFMVILKFTLMGRYGYTFSEATARMWTSFFESMIQFVNDPDIIIMPLVSIVILSSLAIGWGIYFLVNSSLIGPKQEIPRRRNEYTQHGTHMHKEKQKKTIILKVVFKRYLVYVKE